MAFTVQNLQLNRGITSSNVQGKYTITIHTYIDTENTTTAIRAYFPDYLNQGASQDYLSVDDHMLVLGSETTIFCKILSLAPFILGPNLFAEADITIEPPIVAFDNNGAIIADNVLQLEIADATHPGILTADTQTIGGDKVFNNDISVVGEIKTDIINELTTSNGTFINGVKLFSNNILFDAGQSTFGTYKESTFMSTFTNNAEVTPGVTFKIIKIGSTVTITGLTQGVTAAQGAPDPFFISDNPIPVEFQPSVPVTGYWVVFNGTTAKIGQIKILAGNIIIYNDVDETTNFTSGVQNAFNLGTFTYNLP